MKFQQMERWVQHFAGSILAFRRTKHGRDEMSIHNTVFLTFFGFLIQTSAAHAKQAPTLFQLAGQYESAVEQFEKVVLRVRGIDRSDEKWVDRLDDESARLRLAARNPRHLSKFLNEWRQLKQLHAKVEERIFGKYTPHHDLIQCWSIVVYQRDLLEIELVYRLENQQHRNGVEPIRTKNAWRDRYLRTMASIQ